jgi:hypothetical protein
VEEALIGVELELRRDAAVGGADHALARDDRAAFHAAWLSH